MENKIQYQVKKIIEDIKTNGDTAVCKYIYRFDGVKISPKQFLIKKSELTNACKIVDKKFAIAIKNAARCIRFYHEQELKHSTRSWFYGKGGIKLGQIVNPVEKVGIYVPGGRYSYPSTILMAAIPAKIAGVKELIIVTPPQNITPEILYTAKLAGVNSIYRIGGPMAVAALAFGTEAIPKVDLIVGPGNVYVTEAKRQLYGVAGIDMLAGPSEVAILCDRYANPECVAYDLLAQVEHDRNSKGYFFCDDIELIKKVKALTLKYFQNQMVLFHKSLIDSIRHINEIAPEHLEIMHRNVSSILPRIKNAGAIFVDEYSSAVVGDYFAGPSHILPTNRAAKFSSGLSVQTFLKRTSLVKYERKELLRNTENIIKLAEFEGLKFHSLAIKIRRKT